MKLIILFILLLPAHIFAQKFYVVDDPDGFVNVRTGPGSEHIIAGTLRNKSIVKADSVLTPTKGWIPLLYLSNNGNPVYIYHDRLKELPKETAKKLNEDLGYEFPYSPYQEVYLLSHDHPDIFAYSTGDCGLQVKNIKSNSILLHIEIPVCLNIIWDDCLSFYTLFEMGEDLNPAFVVYKLFKNKENEYGFYTEISPEARKIPIEQAKKNIRKIRKEIEGNSTYMIGWEAGAKIVEAYVSGVDATDILENSVCDAGLCHDIANYLTLIEAYRLNKIKPVE